MKDGFYEGELLDGRKGLVPSNFIQRLQGEDLVEFHRAAVLGLQICGDDSSTTSLPRDLLGVSPNHQPSSHLAGGVGNRAGHPSHPSIHQLPSHPHQQQQQLQQQQQQHQQHQHQPGLPHQQPIAANEPIDQGPSHFGKLFFILFYFYLFIFFSACGIFVCDCVDI